MEEVEGWLGGETDYVKLRGGTGPLVYPAGFVYAFAGLRWLVGGGGRGAAALRAAQWAFLGIYLATQALVLRIYGAARSGPPWVALLLLLSKRLHSLYYLRLFNDCVAMLLQYGALALLAGGLWLPGVLAWSAAVSVKMNGLLLLPALGLLLLRNCGVARTAAYLAAGVALQAALGAPFLLTHPRSYLSRAFELSRVFMWQWTVNWRFLPEETFVSPRWAAALLCAHLVALLALAHFSWSAADGGLYAVCMRVWGHAVGSSTAKLHGGEGGATATAAAGGDDTGPVATRLRRRSVSGGSVSPAPLSPRAGARRGGMGTVAHLTSAGGAFCDSPSYVLYVLLACNFVGVAFSRTLHYQFYTWYAHALPLLLWRTDLPLVVRVAVLATIEAAFNVGDAAGAGTPFSSAALTSAHMLLLASLFTATVPHPVKGTSGEGVWRVGFDSALRKTRPLARTAAVVVK